MKKMFFTAIALVAFVGNSFANTKEVKSVSPVKKETKKVILTTPCDKLWIAFYQYYIDTAGGAGSSAAWGYADSQAAVYGC